MSYLVAISLGILTGIGYLFYEDYEQQQASDYARAHPAPSMPSPSHYEISDGEFDWGNDRYVTRIEPRCAWVDYTTYIRIPCAMIMKPRPQDIMTLYAK